MVRSNFGENGSRVFLAIMMMLMFTSGTAFAALTEYDNFSDATASASKWEQQEWEPNAIQITGGEAVLNLNAATQPKYARLAMTQQVSLADDGDALHITWDMKQESLRDKSYFNGLAIGTGSSASVEAGQAGKADGAFPGQVFLEGARSGGDMGAVWLHYDLTVSATSQTLKVYTQNPSFDNDPQQYEGTTPAWTSTSSTVLPTDTDLSVHFYVEQPWESDTAASARATLYIDNVFTTIPEPSSLSLLGLGVLLIAARRRDAVS